MSGFLDDDDSFDPYDMNKSEFNPSLYMYEQVKNCSLEQLLTRKNNIDREMLEISGSMQSLLYDNYNKFIRAMDMISGMRKDFGKMEEQVDMLTLKMADVEVEGSAVLDNLQNLKDRLSRLQDSQKFISKLNVLVDLVPTLQKFVDENMYAAAVRQSSKATSVLSKYGDLPAFSRIRDESDVIMGRVKSKLREKISCEVYSHAELAETMNLLLQLGEPKASILTAFFENAEVELEKILYLINAEETSIESSKLLKENELSQKSCELECVDLSCAYLDVAKKVILSYKSVFIDDIDARIAEEECQLISELENFVWMSTARLFDNIRCRFEEMADQINDDVLASALDKLYCYAHEFFMLLPETNLCANNIEIIIEICANRCRYNFKHMKQGFDEVVSNLHSVLSTNTKKLQYYLNELEMDVNELIKNSLLGSLHYVQKKYRFARNANFQKIFCKGHVRDGLLIFFIQYMNKKALDFCSTLKNAAAIFLVLAKYFKKVHNSSIRPFLSLIDEYFGEDCEFDSSAIFEECEATAEKLLGLYVEVKQRDLSMMVKKSMESKNWMEASEPRMVRSVIKRIIEDLVTAKMEIDQLFEDSEDKHSSDSGYLMRSQMSLDGCSVLSGSINRLFSADVFRKPVFDRESILGCIVKMTLKSLLEFVRLKTFNSYGLQQVQVDVHYLRLHLEELIRSEMFFYPMFDEIMSNCYNRTLTPYSLMSWHVVEAICQNF